MRRSGMSRRDLFGKSWTNTITARLGVVVLLLFGASLTQITINLFALGDLEGREAWTDLAGQRRMRAYQMVHLVQHSYDHAPGRSESVAEIRELQVEMDSALSSSSRANQRRRWWL